MARKEMELEAKVDQAVREIRGVAGQVKRIDNQQQKLNKSSKKWFNSIMTSAKHLAGAYITFQGISTVMDAIGGYTQAWVEQMQQVEQSADNIVDAFSQIQLQTVAAGDNWAQTKRDIFQTMKNFPVKPQEQLASQEVVRSVLSGQQWSRRERLASMRAAMRHASMTTLQPQMLATIQARLRNMFDQEFAGTSGAWRLQGMLERTIAKGKLGGEKLKRFVKYLTRAGASAQSWGRDLPSMLSLATGYSGIVANPARALKHQQILMRELSMGGGLGAGEPTARNPFPQLRRMKELMENGELADQIGDAVSKARRKARRRGDMEAVAELTTKRVVSDIKPLLSKMDQIESAYREIKRVGPTDLKEQFGKVMRDPTKHLKTIRDNAEAQLKILRAQNVGMQEWSTTFKVMEPAFQKLINRGVMAPGTAKAITKGMKTAFKTIPGMTPARALRMGLTGTELAGADRFQVLRTIKEQARGAAGGRLPMFLRRLQMESRRRLTPGPPGTLGIISSRQRVRELRVRSRADMLKDEERRWVQRAARATGQAGRMVRRRGGLPGRARKLLSGLYADMPALAMPGSLRTETRDVEKLLQRLKNEQKVEKEELKTELQQLREELQALRKGNEQRQERIAQNTERTAREASRSGGEQHAVKTRH